MAPKARVFSGPLALFGLKELLPAVFVRNPLMLREGYAPASDVARAMSKNLSTLHRMVGSGRAEGVKDGHVLYVRLDPLIARLRKEQNRPLAAALVRLKKALRAEAREKLGAAPPGDAH